MAAYCDRADAIVMASSRSFGIGGNDSFDIFPAGDSQTFSTIDLILEDGGRVHFNRVSRGTGYADAKLRAGLGFRHKADFACLIGPLERFKPNRRLGLDEEEGTFFDCMPFQGLRLGIYWPSVPDLVWAFPRGRANCAAGRCSQSGA
jgi:hypothetical protein